MFCHKVKVVVVLLLGSLLNGGCNTAKTAPDRDIQQETYNRWNRCIERFIDNYEGTVEQSGNRAKAYCEGYARDIFAIYPQHLKNQIESLLSQRANTISTARVIKTGRSVYKNSFQDSELETLKEQLKRARWADL